MMENDKTTPTNNTVEELDSLDILYAKPEMTKKDKLRNFLYYHKTVLVLGAVALIILGVLIGQVASKTDPDVTVLYAGRYYIDPTSYDAIENALKEFIVDDLNSDGQLSIRIISRTIKTPDKHKQEQDGSDEYLYNSTSVEELSVFRTELMAGESVICLIDENLYKTIEDKERFLELSSALGYTPENAEDEYAVYLKDTPLADACPELEALADDTLICIKRRIVTLDKEIYDNNLEAFKRLFKETEN